MSEVGQSRLFDHGPAPSPVYPDQQASPDRPGMSSWCQRTKSLRSSPLRGGQEPRDRMPAERAALALARLRAPS